MGKRLNLAKFRAEDTSLVPSAQGRARIPSGRRTEGTEHKPEDGAKRNTELESRRLCQRGKKKHVSPSQSEGCCKTERLRVNHLRVPTLHPSDVLFIQQIFIEYYWSQALVLQGEGGQ